MRDETHTMHAIPMIPNEDHDYGSRNFNQRDKNSINPVSKYSIITQNGTIMLICLQMQLSCLLTRI